MTVVFRVSSESPVKRQAAASNTRCSSKRSRPNGGYARRVELAVVDVQSVAVVVLAILLAASALWFATASFRLARRAATTLGPAAPVLLINAGDSETLLSLARQIGVAPTPTRTERRRRHIGRLSANLPQLPLTADLQRSDEQAEFYEDTRDLNVVLRAALALLDRCGMLRTDLATVPSLVLAEDTRFEDRTAIARVLREFFEHDRKLVVQPTDAHARRSGGSFGGHAVPSERLADELSEALGHGVPISRLVEAKRVEFQAAMGQLVLIEGQWSASPDEHEHAIFMYLHELAVQDGPVTSTRIPMPNGLAVYCTIPDEFVVRGRRSMLTRLERVPLSVLGQVTDYEFEAADDVGGLVVNPVAVFTRLPDGAPSPPSRVSR